MFRALVLDSDVYIQPTAWPRAHPPGSKPKAETQDGFLVRSRKRDPIHVPVCLLYRRRDPAYCGLAWHRRQGGEDLRLQTSSASC